MKILTAILIIVALNLFITLYHVNEDRLECYGIGWWDGHYVVYDSDPLMGCLSNDLMTFYGDNKGD